MVMSGCGFEPLYGPKWTGDSYVENQLAEVKIALIPDREGQILRNHLLDKLNAAGEPTFPQAYLHVSLVLDKVSVSVRRDGTTQRFNVVATAEITLKDQNRKKTLYNDTIKHVTSYSIGELTAEFGYASLTSEADAKKRVLELLANEIKLMLATYYKKWRS